MPDYSILLLPKDGYWNWVAAAKDYVLKFSANLTPDPDAAGRYMTPQQTVTIAGAPNGYPAQGDIQAWFKKNYPSVRLDYVSAATPADFQAALKARVDANDRYLQKPATLQLKWPTEFPKITQAFGINPQIYRRFGLPGHEGIDFRAPHGTKIFACADGTVSRVDVYAGDPNKQPYGNNVRIQHEGGYQTTYAHFLETHVKVGDVVKAGQVLGLSDSTGNSSGAHLHLTLKKAGATDAGLTNYPYDIIDPTPFLVFPDGTTAGGSTTTIAYAWPARVCLVGVNGRADGRMEEADFTVVSQARVEAVKLLTTAAPEDVDRLRAINPNMFIMVRLFASFQGRTVRSDEFPEWVKDDMAQFYKRGVRYFEVHNEPNLQIEGWSTSWKDGAEFGRWFQDVVKRLRPMFPEAKFGYPGLSPGDNISGQRMNSMAFLSGSDEACRNADWIALHCYWQNEAEMEAPNDGRGYLEYRRRFPDKVLFITEFSNPSPTVNKSLKGNQYTSYLQSLRSVPGVGAAFSFVLSASSQFPHEAWRDESGQASAIPSAVGGRKF